VAGDVDDDFKHLPDTESQRASELEIRNERADLGALIRYVP
jgi:hypothetical protein